MRPGRFHPGNNEGLAGLVEREAASMRPGRFHPGNVAQRLHHRAERDASMRPGRFHPGNRLSFEQYQGALQLQ